MGKAEEMNDKVPAMSAQTEASKLLEQALMQMDGIISGNSGTIKSHSPEFTFPKTPSAGIRDAANSLIQILQNTANPPSPDPHIAKALLDWLQQNATDQRMEIHRKSGYKDLKSSYSAGPPLGSSGVHVNISRCPLSPTLGAGRPPKPLPRNSLLEKREKKEHEVQAIAEVVIDYERVS